MKIRWTDPAQTDLLDICEYIARSDPAAAERVGGRVLAAVQALAAKPRLGRPGRVLGTRELAIPRLPYVVIYRIAESAHSPGGQVEVLRVLHGARRWPAASR